MVGESFAETKKEKTCRRKEKWNDLKQLLRKYLS